MSWLRDEGMALPAVQGLHGTWRHPGTGDMHHIDYVMVEKIVAQHAWQWVDRDVPLCKGAIDHHLVMAWVRLRKQGSTRGPWRALFK
eukprot:9326029-Lingulodinium_polyedra.AAC.1